MVARLAAAFGRFVSRRGDEELAALMAGPWRGPLLWGIFRSVPWLYDREAAAGERALIEIHVRDEPGRPADRRTLLIGRGRCRVSRHDLGEPDTAIVFAPVAFLRFAAGQRGARELFFGGQMHVDGSLFLAAELPSMFRFPRPPPEAQKAPPGPG